MSRLILDAGALVGYERRDDDVALALEAAWEARLELVTSAMTVAQAWRDSRGRQVMLAQLLAGIDVHPVEEEHARAAGILLGRSRTSDAVDAVLVLLARDGDRILTSDPDDIRHLVMTAGRRVSVVRC